MADHPQQPLTIASVYIEMATRILKPALLGFGLLAIRNRIKR